MSRVAEETTKESTGSAAAWPIILERPHPAAIEVDELLASCDLTRGRTSGPGGQHRNKVETKVTLVHTPTGVTVHASERRSVEENKRVAVFRLRLALAVEVRTPVPIGEIRSGLWRERCPDGGGGRIACNPEHHDYPSLLAEAMDVVFACGLDVKKAALRLCCSTSQLIKLIKDHPHAMARLNQERVGAGMHSLK